MPLVVEDGSVVGAGFSSALASGLFSEDTGSAGLSELDEAAGAVVLGAEVVDEVGVVVGAVLGWGEKRKKKVSGCKISQSNTRLFIQSNL